jgi:hypothetical protein
MISAYCPLEGGVLHASGTKGASCDGPPGGKPVVVCLKQ